MNATAPGVWEKEIASGVRMTCNTNLNMIYVTNDNGSNLRYECPDGIYLSDIEQIENGILRALNAGHKGAQA